MGVMKWHMEHARDVFTNSKVGFYLLKMHLNLDVKNQQLLRKTSIKATTLLHDIQWEIHVHTVLPVKSDSDVMFCLQSFQGLRIDRSIVY